MEYKTLKSAMTIAGSDCSGGAGIQADLKTFTAFGVFGTSAITAITVQNTCGVTAIHNIPKDIIKGQMEAIFEDIMPDSVKIGMVSSVEIIETIVESLQKYNPKTIVVDPVMISTSGSKLLSDDSMEALKTKLIPLATIITPNIPEAECLTGIKIVTKDDMVTAAKQISKFYNGYIMVKGGHLTGTNDDLLYKDGEKIWFDGIHIDNENTHGTGCTLSSAISSCLALGMDMTESVKTAKEYVAGAISFGLNLGKGSGPLNHMYDIL